ncbi:MAG TPA: hypothetical protein VE569_09590 [Acidimicrobiia bacterium]|jgi:septal ring factor EnvC (AmiA/AmiB activator)|nr:hypothetical protein [Acidimicrobiia bacterium]
MPLSEAARHDLYSGLRDVIGPELAETLMSVLPIHELEDMVTKTYLHTEIGDVRAEIADVRAEIADVRAELKTEIAAVRTEIADVRAELKTGISNLRAEVKSDLAALNQSLNRSMVAVVLANMAAIASVAFFT